MRIKQKDNMRHKGPYEYNEYDGVNMYVVIT